MKFNYIFTVALVFFSIDGLTKSIVSESVDNTELEELRKIDTKIVNAKLHPDRKEIPKAQYLGQLIAKDLDDNEIVNLLRLQYPTDRYTELLKKTFKKYEPGKVLTTDLRVLRFDLLLVISFRSGKRQQPDINTDKEINRVVRLISEKMNSLSAQQGGITTSQSGGVN